MDSSTWSGDAAVIAALIGVCGTILMALIAIWQTQRAQKALLEAQRRDYLGDKRLSEQQAAHQEQLTKMQLEHAEALAEGQRKHEAALLDRGQERAAALSHREWLREREAPRADALDCLASDLLEVQRHSMENWVVGQNMLQRIEQPSGTPYELHFEKFRYDQDFSSVQADRTVLLPADLREPANKLRRMLKNVNDEVNHSLAVAATRDAVEVVKTVEFLLSKFEAMFCIWTVLDPAIHPRFEWRRHPGIEGARLAYMRERNLAPELQGTLQPEGAWTLPPKELLMYDRLTLDQRSEHDSAHRAKR